MSAKIETIYVCSNCDAQFSKWNGRCLECGAWGTLKSQTIDSKQAKNDLSGVSAVEVMDLNRIRTEDNPRLATGVKEIDRVLGGGIVPGSLVLLSGEPGIGKSTMLAQLANKIAENIGLNGKQTVVYASGEESAGQIKNRLSRLGKEINFGFIGETNIEKIIKTIQENKSIRLAIVDSIQTVYTSQVPSEAGSINQIRAATLKFLEFAKANDVALVMTGHITKDGQVAGPKTLEHIVDTVIYLEKESAHDYSILRASKNRFGSVNEIGIFEMTGAGFKEINNPAAIFIESGQNKIPGSVISCIIEGTRPFFVEIQALVSKTPFGYPQRKAAGFDLNRLQVLCAVLTKRAKVNLSNQDVILNVVGGLKVNDPGLDLAVCLAIISSLLNQPIGRDSLALGEVGLGGEVRNVRKINERLKEAEKLGYIQAYVPDSNIKAKKIKAKKISQLADLVKTFS